MVAQAIYGESKPPLTHDELREIIDLVLWAGQLLLQHGAETQRIEETVHRMGTALGCDWLDVLISPNALVVTASSGGEFRTKTRRVVAIGVNMDVITQINTLSRQVSAGLLDASMLRAELRRISDMPRLYNRWLSAGVIALSCAAYSQLFGGDWVVFAVTLMAAFLAMLIRQELTNRYFNPYLITIATAFVAGLIASSAVMFDMTRYGQIALAASVLLLVPGVALINSAEDLIKGHTVTGLVRGVTGALVSLCIAIGLLLAMSLAGITGLTTPLGSVSNQFHFYAFWSSIAAFGFAVMFNTPRHLLVYCAACGALGHAFRVLLQYSGLSIEISTLAAATLVGFCSQLLARRAQVPAPIFATTGVIPMVPGTFAFRAMIAIIAFSTAPDPAASAHLLLEASSNFIKTGIILAGLAVGIAAPTLLFERNKPVV